ncbi:MAG: hypothetical protein ACRELF_20535, partial [Gemmataceae bacterium]
RKAQGAEVFGGVVSESDNEHGCAPRSFNREAVATCSSFGLEISVKIFGKPSRELAVFFLIVPQLLCI